MSSNKYIYSTELTSTYVFTAFQLLCTSKLATMQLNQKYVNKQNQFNVDVILSVSHHDSVNIPSSSFPKKCFRSQASLKAGFRNVGAGDRIRIDYSPNDGVRLKFNLQTEIGD